MKLCPFRLATRAGQKAIAIQIIANESQMIRLMIGMNAHTVSFSSPRIRDRESSTACREYTRRRNASLERQFAQDVNSNQTVFPRSLGVQPQSDETAATNRSPRPPKQLGSCSRGRGTSLDESDTSTRSKPRSRWNRANTSSAPCPCSSAFDTNSLVASRASDMNELGTSLPSSDRTTARPFDGANRFLGRST
jgi:hypothetical protein